MNSATLRANGRVFVHEETALQPCIRLRVCLVFFRILACPSRRKCVRRDSPAYLDGCRKRIFVHPTAPAYYARSEGRPGRRYRMVRGNDRSQSSGPLRMEWKKAEARRPDYRGRPSLQKWTKGFEPPENFLGQR